MPLPKKPGITWCTFDPFQGVHVQHLLLHPENLNKPISFKHYSHAAARYKPLIRCPSDSCAPEQRSWIVVGGPYV